ncbi:MAG: (2Fe-2S)-binding protein [Deltaproteobacteria bacterium]|nr:(2Fe-2S)-binding protein [Deltaproteobacteria bacterium]
MSQMIPIAIDGLKVEVPYDTSLLAAAAKLGIRIPTMCHNENVKAYGVCRVCMVEVDEGRKKRLVPSCVYTVRSPISVSTKNDKVRNARRWILEFMLARSPNESAVRDLAAEYGLDAPHPRLMPEADANVVRFERAPDRSRYFDESACILCGLCVRVCDEIVGANAIAFEGRGVERRVTTPFNEENEACIACGACEAACPTKCIGFIDTGGVRELVRWKKKTNMIACEICGNWFMPESLARVYRESMNIPESVYKQCTDCRKSVFA